MKPHEEPDHLEVAWFTNSYPQHEHSVTDIIYALKVSSIALIAYELITSSVLAKKAFQFISVQTKLNNYVVQLGTMVHFVCSLL